MDVFHAGRPGCQALQNVLQALVAHSPSVGYHKAMCPVVGTLLLHMDEEEAFWMMVQMYKRCA